jgi:hypothetical protein
MGMSDVKDWFVECTTGNDFIYFIDRHEAKLGTLTNQVEIELVNFEINATTIIRILL